MLIIIEFNLISLITLNLYALNITIFFIFLFCNERNQLDEFVWPIVFIPGLPVVLQWMALIRRSIRVCKYQVQINDFLLYDKVYKAVASKVHERLKSLAIQYAGACLTYGPFSLPMFEPMTYSKTWAKDRLGFNLFLALSFISK
jgi:hypothetical protein